MTEDLMYLLQKLKANFKLSGNGLSLLNPDRWIQIDKNRQPCAKWLNLAHFFLISIPDPGLTLSPSNQDPAV